MLYVTKSFKPAHAALAVFVIDVAPVIFCVFVTVGVDAVVAVSIGVYVPVTVGVFVCVHVGVGVLVDAFVTTSVIVHVGVYVYVGVFVRVHVGVLVDVPDSTGGGVNVIVIVYVLVTVEVTVFVDVPEIAGVGVQVVVIVYVCDGVGDVVNKPVFIVGEGVTVNIEQLSDKITVDTTDGCPFQASDALLCQLHVLLDCAFPIYIWNVKHPVNPVGVG